MIETVRREQQAPAEAKPATPYWAVVLLALSALAVYADSFSVPFFFDDTLAIGSNPSIRHLWPPWLPMFPSPNVTTSGRPVLNLSFALNYAVSGFQVVSYHAFNLLVHLLAALTLLGLVRRTLLQPILRPKFGADATPLALAIALLWMLNPLQTEAVTYISQRAESLMGLFYLLTLYAFIRAAETQENRRLWSILCVAACFLGMATKEVMVTAPLVALLYDRTFLAGSFREAGRQRWPLYAAMAATWLIVLASLLDVSQRSVGMGLGVTPWSYALTECGAIVRYLALVLWPHPLLIDYGTQMEHAPLQVIPQALLVLVLLAATVHALVRHPRAGFAAAWFFLILAPTSSFMPIVLSPIAEHRLYLPLAAPLAVVVLGLYVLGGRRAVGVAATALAFVYGLLTFERNRDYLSEGVLWQQVVDAQPSNARGHTNLGNVFYREGRLDEAAAQYQQALAIQPAYGEAGNNLGDILMQLGRLDEAIAEFRSTVEADPGFASAHYDLGNALSQKGQFDAAIEQYQATFQLRPDDAELQINWGNALLQKGEPTESIAHFQEALQLKPESLEAHNGYGNALLGLRDWPSAAAEYAEAVRLDPNCAPAHFNWGVALVRIGRPEEAIGQFQKAIELNYSPQADVYADWGAALYLLGRPGEAEAQLHRALDLDPQDQAALSIEAKIKAATTAAPAKK